MKKKVAVAISGGVDSGTALFLLKQQGFDTIAVFTDYFECSKTASYTSCCSLDSVRRARETAEFLNVPFYIMDFKKEFKTKVVEPFIEYYNEGLTPNPCIWCNSKLRFSLLVDKLNSMGIEYLATGHYARIKDGRLFRARYNNKDQSYFLYNISPNVLKNVIFPLGEMKKKDVYQIAKANKLPVCNTPESQDCCILMEENLFSYLNKKVSLKKGETVNLNGDVIGEHTGYQNFTLGQRKGLGSLNKKSYVIDIIPHENKIVVGDEKDLYFDSVMIKINFANFFAEEGEVLKIKLRSTQPAVGCEIENLDFNSNICKIKFIEPQRSPTPGQSAVLYKGSAVAGGGEILKDI